jgi:hypothetical protein
MAPAVEAETSRAVLRVSCGRGFIVEGKRDRLVITAGHCLPSFPRCSSFPLLKERTYPSLLGRIGEAPTVWAECLFVDPIGDIAVLGPPDSQVYGVLSGRPQSRGRAIESKSRRHRQYQEESDAYDAMLGELSPLQIAEALLNGEAWLLALDGNWFKCKITGHPRGCSISGAEKRLASGMSGSPIVNSDGAAIGVITGGVCEPSLVTNLPAWILRELREP